MFWKVLLLFLLWVVYLFGFFVNLELFVYVILLGNYCFGRDWNSYKEVDEDIFFNDMG